MEHYRGIQIPTQHWVGKGNQTESGTNLKEVKCVLRFPFFNKTWNDDSIDFYEGNTLDHFPTKEEVWNMLPTDKYNLFPMSPGDRHFWESLKSCSDAEIYFLDPFFSATNLARLKDVIDYMDCQIDRAATRICIYTCSGNEWDALKCAFQKHHDKYA